MKGISKAIRAGIFAALNGNITVNVNGAATVIPVRDKQAWEGEGQVYVLIGTVTAANIDTQTTFTTRATFDIHIVAKTWNGVTSDVIDDIDNEVGLILIPTHQGNGLGTNADFQFLGLNKDRARDDEMRQGASNIIARKIITYSLIVNQK